MKHLKRFNEEFYPYFPNWQEFIQLLNKYKIILGDNTPARNIIFDLFTEAMYSNKSSNEKADEIVKFIKKNSLGAWKVKGSDINGLNKDLELLFSKKAVS